jgi:beta-galactosidase GanA
MMRLGTALFAVLVLALLPGLTGAAPALAGQLTTATPARHSHTISYDKYSLIIDGKRQLIYSGEFHPFRLPSPSLWPDVLQKMKAAGFNAVTVYFDWDYHSPAPGVYDFSGIRNMDEFLDMAAQAGLYVIARPGPYINAETDGGGFPGWWNDQPGTGRSDDPQYLKWALQWEHQIDTILARHQLTNGTGTVILDQVENEFYDQSTSSRNYMADLEQQIRADGITVPLDGNHNASYASGVGAVQIPGYDMYPDGFNCTNTGNYNPPGDVWYVHNEDNNSPATIPEFQGGSFDPWGGAGYAACQQMVGSAFETASARDLLASGISILSYYMTYGGTSWGFEPYPGVYSSYDYGAALDEARQLTPKYFDQKRIAYEIAAEPELAQLDRVSSGTAVNPAISEIVDANPSTGTHLYLVQHASNSDTANDTTALDVSTADGTFTVPNVDIHGHDTKLLLADYDLASGAHVVYSTSELMTDAQVGGTDTAVYYGPAGESGETLLHYAGQPTVRVLSGSVTSNWDAATGDLKLDYTHNGVATVLISQGGRTTELLLADTASTDRLWRDGSGAAQLITTGPYLVRSGSVDGRTARLTGDTDGPTTITVRAPAGVDRVSWNGKPVAVHRAADGTLVGQLAGPPRVTLPQPTDWKFQYGSDETSTTFDDSGWTLADHTTSNVGTPAHEPVLYADDYGFHHGFVWYRAHFTAAGTETGINLTGQGGGSAGEYEVWLNGAELGTSPSGSKTFTFPSGLLKPGQDNVVSVLVFNSGHDEGGGQSVRGLTDAQLLGSTAPVTWRIQGAKGGETLPDPTRGPLNVSGLDGERDGWYLPGYPDSGWQQVTLPDSWAQRGLPSGDGWYRSTFDLNLPAGTDVPIGLKITDDTTRAYRAEIFVNGWLVGLYANDLGPQHVFSLPAGILHDNGRNTIAIASWGLNGSSGGLGQVSLVPYGTYAGGVPVRDVPAPGWNPTTWGNPQPPAQVALGLTGDKTLVITGTQVKVTATASNVSGGPAQAGPVTLTAPAGWTVTPGSGGAVGTLDPHGSAARGWTVTVPSGLAPGTYQLVAALDYTQNGRSTTAHATYSITVPSPSLASTFSNVGITDDSAASVGDFDGAGYSFSAQALAAAGLTPGKQVTVSGATLTWPDVPAGQPDNTPANGQAISLSGQGTSLVFVGASNSGSPTANGTVVYTDGTSQTFSLTLDDFWYAPSAANQVVASMPYLNSPGGRYNQTVYVFSDAVPIDPSKSVAAVVLPGVSSGPAGHSLAMHIFALGVG